MRLCCHAPLQAALHDALCCCRFEDTWVCLLCSARAGEHRSDRASAAPSRTGFDAHRLQVASYFKLKERNSKLSTEVRAGAVTFLTVRRRV